MNDFTIARKRKNLSQSELAKKCKVSLHTVKKLESASWKEVPFSSLVVTCHALDISFPELLKKHFGIQITVHELGNEEFEQMVHTFSISRVQLIILQLDEFCQLTKTRKLDYDLIAIFSDITCLHKLVILNSKLREKKISINLAVKEFPYRTAFSRRKTSTK